MSACLFLTSFCYPWSQCLYLKINNNNSLILFATHLSKRKQPHFEIAYVIECRILLLSIISTTSHNRKQDDH